MADRGGERSSTATVLFTDLTGSTEIRRSIGDDRADDLRRRHDDAVRAAAAEHLGEVVKGTGDGLMIVFPAAAEGVAGAVAIQRAIVRLSRERSLDAPLAVRVGLSAGDVAWADDDCFGTAVVEAARLCDASGGGRILVSEVVRLLAGSRGGHVFESVGTLDLKGLGPLPAYEVRWSPADDPAASPLPPALAHPDTTLPLVGRAEEREQITTAWKKAREGAPHLVLVGGEPGVGKTRLVAEVARQAHADGAVVLFGRCDDEMGVPYQPFAEAIAAFAASMPDAGALADALGPAAADLARLVPSLTTRLQLAEPLRADPETERYRLFEGVASFLSTLSSQAPVVLVARRPPLGGAPDPAAAAPPAARRPRPESLLVVATYRDTDLGRGHPLAEALADLRREPDVVRVVLRGLGGGRGRRARVARRRSRARRGGDSAWPRRCTARPRATRSSSARCCATSSRPAAYPGRRRPLGREPAPLGRDPRGRPGGDRQAAVAAGHWHQRGPLGRGGDRTRVRPRPPRAIQRCRRGRRARRPRGGRGEPADRPVVRARRPADVRPRPRPVDAVRGDPDDAPASHPPAGRRRPRRPVGPRRPLPRPARPPQLRGRRLG